MTTLVITTSKGREPTLPAFLFQDVNKGGVVLGGAFGDRSGGKIAVHAPSFIHSLINLSNTHIPQYVS